MPRKLNLTFVTSVILKIKVMTSKWIGFLKYQYMIYNIIYYNMIAVKHLSYRVETGVQTDRWTAP